MRRLVVPACIRDELGLKSLSRATLLHAVCAPSIPLLTPAAPGLSPLAGAA